MEKKFIIEFSKLNLPSVNKNEFLIELIHSNKSEMISYPQDKPFILLLSKKPEKESMLIKIKSKISSKNPKTYAFGELTISKNTPLQEKYIILLIKDKDKDNIKNSNYQMGKIYIQIKLEKLNNELKSPNNKNENQITKAKTIDSLYRHSKEDASFIDKIAKSIKIQNIDKNDIKLYDINSIISKESINKLKEYVENKKKIEDLLPKDINSLKSYNIGLLNEYKILNHNYNNFLIKIIKNNEELKQKSNKYENLNEGLEDEMKELTQELQASKELFDNNKSSKKYIAIFS